MGTAESKGNHRHRTSKHQRYKEEKLKTHTCHHKNKQLGERLISRNKSSTIGTHETLAPRLSVPLNPNLHGSILQYSFPMQRTRSEIQVISSEPTQSEITGDVDHVSYDYQKHMQRVDEANRPVLERLCPDKMYVSTNDLRICDTQRLPPPMRCKMTQGFFRPVTPAQVYQKKTKLNALIV